MNYKNLVLVLFQLRKLSTSSQLNAGKNHYDSLGITKSATQADVKGAYYELSKVYHPDKNQGNTSQREQHSQKFRDITEAYEVLGNVKTRRMYDKGFMNDRPQTTSYHSPDDPLHKFYKSRDTRHRPPPPSGQTPIYDFDEWSKRHYGETFRRSQEMKKRHAFHAKLKSVEKDDAKLEVMLWCALSFVVFCMLIKEGGNSQVAIHLFGANVRKKPVTDVD